jgi:hypothetical protein
MNSDANRIKGASVLGTVFVFGLLALLAPAASSQSADDLFRDALTAENKGELLRAIELYKLLVQQLPNSIAVRASAVSISRTTKRPTFLLQR